MENENRVIAWEIAYHIMSHSCQPLELAMIHPCGEQYECLALMPYGREYNSANRMLINLYGSGILAGGKDDLIQKYQEKYKEDKNTFISLVAQLCNYTLLDTPNKKIYAMEFLLEQIIKDKNCKMNITSTWYDGSYSSFLVENAKLFPYYTMKDIRDADIHRPWWIISVGNNAIAICNIKTDEMITLDGSKFKLESEYENAKLKLELLANFYTTIDDVKSHLSNDTEWKDRYSTYAVDILKNIDSIQVVRQTFREWTPLKMYLNVTNAKQSDKNVNIELRYLGQSVAVLTYKKMESLLILSTKDYDEKNKRDFDCSITLSNVDWRSEKAKELRSFFKNRKHNRLKNDNKGNEEHRIESLLLSEFSKSKNKALPYIQPIKIANIRFPMPTPISASNHKKITYCGFRGGGIDIFTRVGRSGASAKLCIIEVKDENIAKEPPKEAVKQALAYAVFIRELIRCEAGEAWWKLFGFSKKIPQKLIICAACAMPSVGDDDESFKNIELDIEGDIIQLHYIYFTEQENKIVQINSSLKN